MQGANDSENAALLQNTGNKVFAWHMPSVLLNKFFFFFQDLSHAKKKEDQWCMLHVTAPRQSTRVAEISPDSGQLRQSTSPRSSKRHQFRF